MANHSDIEWTDATWNPIAGCSLVSPGCTNCYAMRRVAPRLSANPATPHYAGMVANSKGGPVWTGKLGIAGDAVMTKPLRWKEPRRIFVNSTSDLFHEDLPDAVIDRIFAVMALTPQHTYQVLTKRSARMREYLTAAATYGRIEAATRLISPLAGEMPGRAEGGGATGRNVALPSAMAPGVRRSKGQIVGLSPASPTAPYPNVWLGVSCEDQRRADERVPDLLATPAAIRFVSAEPLLGPIDFSKWLERGDAGLREIDPLASVLFGMAEDDGTAWVRPALDWIIVGGESGRDARPMHPDWARQIRDQCQAAGTAFFFKQWGEFRPLTAAEHGQACGATLIGNDPHDREAYVLRVGKHRAGRLLDGHEHSAFPSSL